MKLLKFWMERASSPRGPTLAVKALTFLLHVWVFLKMMVPVAIIALALSIVAVMAWRALG